jgi:hypothetical protein
MKSKPTNRFELTVEGYIGTINHTPILQWLNIQHTGKPNVSMDTKVRYTKSHLDATWNVSACRKFRLLIEIDKQGNWKVLKINGKSVKQ